MPTPCVSLISLSTMQTGSAQPAHEPVPTDDRRARHVLAIARLLHGSAEVNTSNLAPPGDSGPQALAWLAHVLELLDTEFRRVTRDEVAHQFRQILRPLAQRRQLQHPTREAIGFLAWGPRLAEAFIHCW